MDHYRYYIFHQRGVMPLAVLQVTCAAMCLVGGCIDALFRKETTLSITRAPLWSGLFMAVPGAFALFASQRKNPLLVNVMVASTLLSHVAGVVVVSYASLTLSYGEEDDEIFHHHIVEVKFALSRLVRGANVTMLLASLASLVVASLIMYVGCRSLPFCACYDRHTGLESLVPQSDPCTDTELVCTRQGGGDRLFNSPVTFMDKCSEQEEDVSSKPPPYSRLA
ncbi:uncharacterized protein LOC114768368 isoform X2 [Denticeps clupeoides]|uniref:Uncharacterized protein n=1 Tax=Denticeps clupeoides TaxID=299321 RepID=A0AAY4ECN0_9TELE|nr:uncharacterized protein LOC114768368 isoform X2 [Denticeps clupeoides]